MDDAWERMERSVKISLHAILLDGTTVLNVFSLMTIPIEVEALINIRPLTLVSDDIRDLEALTPNHFIMGRVSTTLATCVTYDANITPRRR